MKGTELSIFNRTSEETTLVGRIPRDDEEKKVLVNALSSPAARVGDMVNLEFSLTNFYIEKTSFLNDDTGEVIEGFRTILIDDENGMTYGTSSNGIANSLRTILTFYGMPDTWHSPLRVKVKELNIGTNRVYTLEVL